LIHFFKNIEFVNPWVFSLLLLLPIFIYFYFKNHKNKGSYIRFSNLEGVEGIVSWRGRLRKILPVIRAIAFCSIVIAIARPQNALQEEKVEAEGIDIMLVMDVSKSMADPDLRPNRLEVAKEAALQFIDGREYDRIGLSIFAGEALTLSPLTSDHSVVNHFVKNLQFGMLPGLTAVGDGLISGLNRLEQSTGISKVIILLTDGENNAGYVQPITAGEAAASLGAKVYTIGLKIRSPILQQIAELSGGKSYYAGSQNALNKIYEEIDQLEKTKIEIAVVKRYIERFHVFAFIGLFLIFLEILLNQTILRTLPA